MTWEQYWLLIRIVMIFDAFIVTVALYFGWWRKRGRILVRVKTPIGERKAWKKPQKDGKTIVMRKGRGKKSAWKFTFTRKALYFFPKWFGRKGLCVDVLYDSDQAVEWTFNPEEVKMPKWDKETSQHFIEAETLKKRATGLKYALPTLFWIMLILQIVCLVFSFLILQRLGMF